MKNSILLWILAFIITLASAVYQRLTGPTYPMRGTVQINGEVIDYNLLRSHGGETDCQISLSVPDSSYHAQLYWKRYKTDDEWTVTHMSYEQGELTGTLPNQPPAGKLEYFVQLSFNNTTETLPGEENIVIRFKGDVPMYILIPHIITMFGAMLLSARTGLEFFRKKGNVKKLTYWTIGLILVGGFILGPAVQLYAFGAWWTGFPFGTDLTDNKTLIALIAWLVAVFMYKRTKKSAAWALGASIITLIIFLIPHSMFGSELDYSKHDINTKVELDLGD